ncbi:hypothetical protein KC318_g73 [Hortaea werneckii]|nr:hypothetical protein KC334_g71 [Hortaea werneckii]KAI7028373.1 hypothetical protein KC355_g72 [Hortaea werneckii]KAI7676764.1 hypothetical protein KC318_g73 [Hortaea werneckii]
MGWELVGINVLFGLHLTVFRIFKRRGRASRTLFVDFSSLFVNVLFRTCYRLATSIPRERKNLEAIPAHWGFLMNGDEVRLWFPMRNERWCNTIAVRKVSSRARQRERISHQESPWRVRHQQAHCKIQLLRQPTETRGSVSERLRGTGTGGWMLMSAWVPHADAASSYSTGTEGKRNNGTEKHIVAFASSGVQVDVTLQRDREFPRFLAW